MLLGRIYLYRYMEHPVCAPDHLVALPLSSAHEWLDNEPGTLDRQGSDVSGGSNRAGSREGMSRAIEHNTQMMVAVVVSTPPHRNAQRDNTLMATVSYPLILSRVISKAIGRRPRGRKMGRRWWNPSN
jgi:hypothetical protein